MIEENSLYCAYLSTLKLHYNRSQELLDEIGIYPGQPFLLFLLDQKEGRSQKELADKLKIAPATLTVMLKRMEKANLIERVRDDKDKRILRVYFTDEGREIVQKAGKAVNQIQEECFSSLTDEEKESLKILLNKMSKNLEKIRKINS